ncbi:TackOD1 domain-containing metal-binding protein [Natronococcus occultus]|uniref:Thaumarchaeal output domain-containing protein n=1 Tax=Natronococcus occultus SP4 TaxID=694430 RepID=L0K1I0_9EURY|nr:hypothetical protein [Natronococcus occultus]AGB38831.1 hypothetical protein Natoc_3088 [Natronococcus occultus SP4]
MASPGELRLIERLTSTEVFEPEIDDDGAVSYTEAGQCLDATDGEPVTVLERFTARGVLADEFITKVYVCPDCTTEGLQYTTACPACKDPHAVQTTLVEHSCGHTGQESAFETDDGYRCPECEQDLKSVDIEKKHRYICKACSERFQTPANRLRCRECATHLPPLEATERVLYRYSLTDAGRQWLDRQKRARQTAKETLEERRFTTEVDTTVTDGGTSQPVHVLACDELMGEQRVVAIHETPTIDDVDRFCAFANESIDAHPVVITTSGAVETDVATRAAETELTVLAFDGNGEGTLEPEYETVETAQAHEAGLFQRLSAVLEIPGRQ